MKINTWVPKIHMQTHNGEYPTNSTTTLPKNGQTHSAYFKHWFRDNKLIETCLVSI